VKEGLSGGILDVAEEGPRLVLQASGVLVEVYQETGSLNQSLVRLMEGCSIDIILDALVRSDSVLKWCPVLVVTG
jgi:hypothetical protein